MFKLLFRLMILALFVLVVIDGISYFQNGNLDSSILMTVWEWIVEAYETVKELIVPTVT